MIGELSNSEWAVAGLAAFAIGLSKSGLKGIGTLVVTVFALVFGSKMSTGIVLPLLSAGDIFAIIYYRKDVNWQLFFKIFPWMITGVLIGTFIGKDLPESLFKYGMAAIIFVSVALMFWWDQQKTLKVPDHWLFSSSLGILGGITTMVGNLAGAFVNLFFLALRVPKAEFIGTAAWLFFFVNLVKWPLHIFSWKTISHSSLMMDLYLLGPLVVGLLVGVKIVALINEAFYRKMILILTALGALLIAIR